MLVIRKAHVSDADAVFQLAQAFATSYRPEREAFGVAWERLLVQEDALLLVAVSDGDVVGYLLGFEHFTLFANGRVAWVEEVMVAERSRKLGVGRGMMSEFEGWARLRDCRLVALATRRAAGFYRAIGYEESAAYFRKLL